MRSYYNYEEPQRARFSFGGRSTATVKILIVATSLLYLVELFLIRKFGEAAIVEHLAVYRPNFVKGAFWQPVTSLFLHDPASLWHLIFNMLGLYFFGSDVERSFGRARFLTLYFLAGVAGALLCLSYGDVAAYGASGAVLGVLAAFAMLFPDARILVFFIFPVRAIWFAIGYAFVSVAGILMAADGVAHWGHLGGLAVGFLFVRTRPWLSRLADGWAARRKHWEAGRSEAEEAELDRILAKVHSEGITALSNQERDFLNIMSRRRR